MVEELALTIKKSVVNIRYDLVPSTEKKFEAESNLRKLLFRGQQVIRTRHSKWRNNSIKSYEKLNISSFKVEWWYFELYFSHQHPLQSTNRVSCTNGGWLPPGPPVFLFSLHRQPPAESAHSFHNLLFQAPLLVCKLSFFHLWNFTWPGYKASATVVLFLIHSECFWGWWLSADYPTQT